MLKLFYLPKNWQNTVSLVLDIVNPLIVICAGFLVSLLPIQGFFPSQATPDIPIIVLFCLLLHKYSNYLIPIFFLCVAVFEYCFMIPMGSLCVHYGMFTLIGYVTWGNHLTNDISFRLVCFYFYVTYFIILVCDIVIFYFLFKGYLGFYNAFLFFITNVIIFPAVFYVIYYFILYKKDFNQAHNL